MKILFIETNENILATRKMALITALSVFFCRTILKRILCAVALCLGASPEDAAQLAGVSRKSALKYMRILDSDGASPLLSIASGGRTSKISEKRSEIEIELDNGNYGTLRQVVAMIQKKYDIHVSRSRLATYLKQIGYKKLQCSSMPSKANPEAQRKFFFGLLRPLMQLAKMGAVKLYFVDASHFVFGTCKPGAIYTKVRRAVRTFSGRLRYNVLGALDYTSKEVTAVANDTYITATEVVQLMEKLFKKNGTDKLIFLVLDNARYQHCKLVMDRAKELGVFLIFLPTYSPNLNLIERLWKWVKAETLNAAYCENFTDFKHSILSTISKTTREAKDALETLIGEKVQLYDDNGNILHYHLA